MFTVNFNNDIPFVFCKAAKVDQVASVVQKGVYIFAKYYDRTVSSAHVTVIVGPDVNDDVLSDAISMLPKEEFKRAIEDKRLSVKRPVVINESNKFQYIPVQQSLYLAVGIHQTNVPIFVQNCSQIEEVKKLFPCTKFIVVNTDLHYKYAVDYLKAQDFDSIIKKKEITIPNVTIKAKDSTSTNVKVNAKDNSVKTEDLVARVNAINKARFDSPINNILIKIIQFAEAEKGTLFGKKVTVYECESGVEVDAIKAELAKRLGHDNTVIFGDVARNIWELQYVF